MKLKLRISLFKIFFLCFIINQTFYAQLGSFYNFNTEWNTEKTYLDVFFINDSIGWVVGSDGTILKTTNAGLSWAIQNSSTNQDIHTVVFFDSLNGRAFTEEKVLTSSNGGNNWSILNNNHYSQKASFGSRLVGCSYVYNHISRTTNGGVSWTDIMFVENNIKDIFFVSENYGFICGENALLGQTSDGGLTWPRQSASYFELLAVDAVSASLGWSVGINGAVVRISNFPTVYQQQSNINQSLVSVDFINNTDGWIVSRTGRILKTTNAGSLWNPEFDLYADSIVSIKVNSADNIWIVGKQACYTNHTGVFSISDIQIVEAKSDSNLIIQIESTGIPKPTYSLEISPTGMIVDPINGLVTWNTNVLGNHLVVVKAQNNFGSRVDSFYVKVVEPNGIEDNFDVNNFGFTLSQNFPNPFNPVTSILYSVPFETDIEFSIFNILGEKIRTIIKERVSVGNHQVQFDGSELISGVYFYTLRSEAQSITKKMHIIK